MLAEFVILQVSWTCTLEMQWLDQWNLIYYCQRQLLKKWDTSIHLKVRLSIQHKKIKKSEEESNIYSWKVKFHLNTLYTGSYIENVVGLLFWEKLWGVPFAQKYLQSALCEYTSGETMRSEFAHRVLSKGETARTLILRKNLGKLACNNSCRSVGQHIAKVITGVPQGWLHSPSHSPLSQPGQKYKHYCYQNV